MKIINNIIETIAQKCLKFVEPREIKVLQKRDRQGNIYWLVFNPNTKSYSYFHDEAEVRMWIEQSYYNH